MNDTQKRIGIGLLIIGGTLLVCFGLWQFFGERSVDQSAVMGTKSIPQTSAVTSVSHASKQDGAEIVTIKGRYHLEMNSQVVDFVLNEGEAMRTTLEGNALFLKPDGETSETAIIHQGEDLIVVPRYSGSKKAGATGITFETLNEKPIKVKLTYTSIR